MREHEEEKLKELAVKYLVEDLSEEEVKELLKLVAQKKYELQKGEA